MAHKLQNKWAIATVSLGKHESHTLERKIAAAASHGFQGIEVVYADLLHHARRNNITPLQSASEIKSLCRSLGVEVLSLNPFKNFEGHLELPLPHRLDTAKKWIELAVAMGAKNLQVPSQFLPNTTGDEEVIITELRALADLAATSGVTIAYEAVAFARFNSLWQDSLRVVRAVDRPNFGMCLDSFHIHARIWADPYAADGKLPHGNQALADSMAEFLASCPKDKVQYVQLSDASKLDPPLTEESPLFEGLEVKIGTLAWSRSARPFPLEPPGYYPVVDIAKTWLLDYQWEGWVSIEGFLTETELEENGPEVMAARARRSIENLCLKINV